MSAQPQTATPLARLSAAVDGLPGAAPWRAWRQATLARLVEAGLPTPRDDAWKYSNLRLLGRRDLAPAAARPVPADALAAAPEPDGGGPRLVFVDGRFQPALSRSTRLAGVEFQPFAAQLGAGAPESLVPPLAGDPRATDERVRALNASLSTDGPVLLARAGQTVAVPVHVIHVATGGGAYPRTRIEVGAGATLHLVETHLSLGDAEAFVAAAADIRLQRGARLTHTSLQILGARTVLLDDAAVTVEADARYVHALAALGGQLARLDLRIGLDGAGASAELVGLLFADGGREQHVRTLVEHRAPRTSSDQLYRGVAAGRGRGSYDGKVVVRPGSVRTESRQSSRNLLIGHESAFESRPQLEINADDVKCSHGATTGTLDEQMLFYLLTRGIAPDTARALLTYAFVGDVLRRLGSEAVRRAAYERVLGRLPAAELLREFVK